MIKMFGASGTKNCGADSKPTGYVTLTNALNSALLVVNSTLCLTQTEWTYTTLGDTNYSHMVLASAEEYVTGGAAANAGADPYYYVAGGLSSYATFGLGNFTTYIDAVTFAGLGVPSPLNLPVLESSHKNGSLITLAKSQAQATNGCFTTADIEHTATSKVAVGGFTASSLDCVDFALAGYVVTGQTLVYEYNAITFKTVVTGPFPATTDSFLTPSG